MLDLQVTQAKVTDLATATVSDLQDLLHGLTKSPAEGMHFLTRRSFTLESIFRKSFYISIIGNR